MRNREVRYCAAKLVCQHGGVLPAQAWQQYRELFTTIAAGVVLVTADLRKMPAQAASHSRERIVTSEVTIPVVELLRRAACAIAGPTGARG